MIGRKQHYGKRNAHQGISDFMKLLGNGSEDRKRQFAEEVTASISISASTNSQHAAAAIDYQSPKRPRVVSNEISQEQLPQCSPTKSRTEAADNSNMVDRSFCESRKGQKQKRRKSSNGGFTQNAFHMDLSHKYSSEANVMNSTIRSRFHMPARSLNTPDLSITMSTTFQLESSFKFESEIDSLITSLHSSIQVFDRDENHIEPDLSVTERSLSTGQHLCSLRPEILLRIFAFVIPTKHCEVWPFYKKGVRASSIYATCWNDEDTVTAENFIPASVLCLLIVNKTFYQYGTKIIYGTNRFCFNDPTAMKWWIKRIGTEGDKVVGGNFGKVQTLWLVIGSGWNNARNAQYPIVFDEQCVEELWYGVVASYIQPHCQSLESLRVELRNWNQTRYMRWSSYQSKDDEATKERWRFKLLDFCADHIRGLKFVQLKQWKSNLLPRHTLEELCHYMKQPVHTAVPRQQMPNRLTLSMVLPNMRLGG